MARRKRRERETMDYLDFARRAISAAGKRVADADEFELQALVGLRAALEDAIRVAVAGQRNGPAERSWADIGRALGITRQSAWERYNEVAFEAARAAEGNGKP